MARPIFTAIAAVTLDGKIAAHKGQNSSWTSKEDKQFLHKFLDRSDVVLVGRTTYEVAYKSLSKRNCIILTSRIKATFKKNRLTLFCNPKTVDLIALITRLGYKKVTILGGQKVYSFFIKNSLLDELFLTIEPLIFGKGLSLFQYKELFSQPVKLISFKRLNSKGSILARYKIFK